MEKPGFMTLYGYIRCYDLFWLVMAVLLSIIPVVYHGMCGMTQKYSDVLINGNAFKGKATHSINFYEKMKPDCIMLVIFATLTQTEDRIPPV